MIISKKLTNRHAIWKKSIALIFAVTMIVMAALPIAAAYPKATNNVADEAKVLSESTVRTLKTSNDKLSADFGVTIAICTVKTTDGTDIAEYARGLFKNWRLGEGILLLIAVDDKDYYFVPSTGVEALLTNDDLAAVRDDYLEEDFNSGNIDRGVLKTVSRLSSVLTSALEKKAEADAENNQSTQQPDDKKENEGTGIGSVIVGFFKVVLWIVLVLAVAFVALFVAAMFNDDCAYILRTYVFRQGKSKTLTYNYDERLYGGKENNRRKQNDPYQQNRQILDKRKSNPSYTPHRTGYNGQMQYDDRRYSQQPANNVRRPNIQNNGYQNSGALPQGGYRNTANNRPQSNNYPKDTYYNADGTPRRPQQTNARRGNTNGRDGAYRQYTDSMNGDETRAFTIPGRGDNGRL